MRMMASLIWSSWIAVLYVCLTRNVYCQDNEVDLQDVLNRVADSLNNFTRSTKETEFSIKQELADIRQAVVDIRDAFLNGGCSRDITTWIPTTSINPSTAWFDRSTYEPEYTQSEHFTSWYITSQIQPSTMDFQHSTLEWQSSIVNDGTISWFSTSEIEASTTFFDTAGVDRSTSWYTASEIRPSSPGFETSSPTYSQSFYSSSQFDQSFSNSAIEPSTADIYQTASNIWPSTSITEPQVSSTQFVTPPTMIANDCTELYNDYGQRSSGPYWIQPKESPKRFQVFCDMDTDGGGWTVIQRRRKGHHQENFNRRWHEYKSGFGDLKEDFWLGNENIRALTANMPSKLRVDMSNVRGEIKFARYNDFYIEGESDNYRLHIGTHFGTAEDSLRLHDKMEFSTFDADNDRHRGTNCAELFGSGWWFAACVSANANDFLWGHWTPISHMEMKIRPY